MKTETSVTELLRGFSDYINRVVYRGESFLLIRGGRAVAELTPVRSGVRASELPALLDSLPRLEEGDAEAFARDLDRARAELESSPERDPWDS
jgi:antitoxin (DNA-binding transcriptional repressor) of toxin-antitoxin stability system